MRDFLAAITAELRRARLAREWTQEDLAERMSVAVETVSNIERGAAIPSLRTLLALAEVLDIDLGSIFSVPIKGQRKISPERARREAKLQKLLAALDDRQLQLVIELALGVTRAGKK
jgi:transcriptional regulator with XRE-family HTH domain